MAKRDRADDRPFVRLEWDKARRLLAAAREIAVVTHVHPDGDAIGSLIGLTLALRENGKNATPFVDDGLPPRFAFLPSSMDIRDSFQGQTPELVVSTDASDRERLGKVGQMLLSNGQPLIQLDHHQTNTLFGDANLVDARTVSSCEGVLDWLDQLGWQPSPAVAQCLLTGVVTDTLCFRTSNVTAETLHKAQRLMQYGADLAGITHRTMVRMPTSLIRLYSRVLPKMRLEDGVIWVAVEQADLDASGTGPGDYTGLSSYLIQADEAFISASFAEITVNGVECSFRAVPGFDVSQIALSLGGGGHVLASGCILHGTTLEKAVEQVIPLLKAEARRGKSFYDR